MSLIRLICGYIRMGLCSGTQSIITIIHQKSRFHPNHLHLQYIRHNHHCRHHFQPTKDFHHNRYRVHHTTLAHFHHHPNEHSSARLDGDGNALELCDGLDNDCDGSLSLVENDDDNDGYVECTVDGDGWDGTSISGG